MLKPSIREIVTQHIFFKKFDENEIFQKNQKVKHMLANRIMPINFNPEDNVVVQDEEGFFFYFIVNGLCKVSVRKFQQEPKYIRTIKVGDYFGECSLLFDCPTTATVKSENYCLFAKISKQVFLNLGTNFI
jgi:CRP-like cAMP-binding protein